MLSRAAARRANHIHRCAVAQRPADGLMAGHGSRLPDNLRARFCHYLNGGLDHGPSRTMQNQHASPPHRRCNSQIAKILLAFFHGYLKVGSYIR